MIRGTAELQRAQNRLEREALRIYAKLPHAEFSLGLGIERSVVILILCGIHEDEPWTKTHIQLRMGHIACTRNWKSGQYHGGDESVGTSLPIPMRSTGYKGRNHENCSCTRCDECMYVWGKSSRMTLSGRPTIKFLVALSVQSSDRMHTRHG